MDPTKQRRQGPLKATLSFLVFVIATYLAPMGAAFTAMIFLERTTDNVWLVVACGTALYWALAYWAVTSYRRYLLIPAMIDISLDPPSSRYFQILASSCALAVPLPLLLAYLPGPRAAWITALSGSLSIWGAAALREVARTESEGAPYIEAGTRGNRLKSACLLRQIVQRRTPRVQQARIQWGAVPLELNEVLKNFLIIGSVGSGKTLLLKAYLCCVLPLVVRYGRWRAVIVDPKWELYPSLLALVPRYKLRILNAGDARTYAWAICKDFRHEKHIHEAAHILIPPLKEETQPFFTDGARRLLQGVMLALKLQAPDDWRFSDVCFVVRSSARLKAILNLHGSTRNILRAYAQNQRVFFDVFATLDSRMAPYYAVASIWSHLQREEPTRSVSLTDWVQGNFVLHIGKQASASASQSAIIALLLKRASQLLLDQATGQSAIDHHSARRTIIAIDEAPRAGKLDILDLVTNGRDYGIGVCCATQSIDAMLEHYTKDRLNALLNEFHSLAMLSANSPTTVEWMANRLGKIDSIQPQQQPDGGKTGQVGWAYALDPTQFQTLRQGRKIGPDCLPGVFFNSELGAWYSDEGVDLVEPVRGAAAVAPIPDRWQTLRTWDDQDLERLHLTPLRNQLELDDVGARSAPAPQSPRQRPPQKNRPPFPRFRT